MPPSPHTDSAAIFAPAKAHGLAGFYPSAVPPPAYEQITPDPPPQSSPRDARSCCLLNVLVLLSLPLICTCLCLTYLVVDIVGPDLLGSVVVAIIRYGDSELIYEGSNEFGSSEAATAAKIYWTDDPLGDVLTHYRRFFTLEPRNSNRFPTRTSTLPYSFVPPVWQSDLRSSSITSVQVIDAAREIPLVYLMGLYFHDEGWKVHELPNRGTIIIVYYGVTRL
jgi:hypothetical protein